MPRYHVHELDNEVLVPPALWARPEHPFTLEDAAKVFKLLSQYSEPFEVPATVRSIVVHDGRPLDDEGSFVVRAWLHDRDLNGLAEAEAAGRPPRPVAHFTAVAERGRVRIVVGPPPGRPRGGNWLLLALVALGALVLFGGLLMSR